MKIKSIKFNKRYIVEPWGYSPNPKAVSRMLLDYRDNSYRREKRPQRKSEYTYIPLFKKNLFIEFKEGLNIIVGENGIGKTQLFKIINDYLKGNPHSYPLDVDIDVRGEGILISVDPENDTPERALIPNPDSKTFMQETLLVMGSKEQSHGENSKFILDGIQELETDIILLDEPEGGLSLRNQVKYLKSIKEMALNKQVILITHSKFFIESVDEIYDFDNYKWKKSDKYIKSIVN